MHAEREHKPEGLGIGRDALVLSTRLHRYVLRAPLMGFPWGSWVRALVQQQRSIVALHSRQLTRIRPNFPLRSDPVRSHRVTWKSEYPSKQSGMPSAPGSTRWPRGPYNALIAAACDGSVERTTALLAEGAINIDQGGPEGWTPLICAVGKGCVRVVRALLKAGADTAVPADKGFTALHFAAQYGHLAVTKILCKAGADLEALTESGASPLLVAADQGHAEIMAALLEAGADPNFRDPEGETPLYSAAYRGHIGAVKALLRAGADPMPAWGRGGPSWGPTAAPELSRLPSGAASQPGTTTFVPQTSPPSSGGPTWSAS